MVVRMSEKKVGRPAMADGEKRKPRSIKMSDEEWLEIQRWAKKAGVSASEYIRQKALAGD